jgi:hypothetical protein
MLSLPLHWYQAVSLYGCLSVRWHASARLPLDGYLWNFIQGTFMEKRREIWKLFKNRAKISGTLLEDLSEFCFRRH